MTLNTFEVRRRRAAVLAGLVIVTVSGSVVAIAPGAALAAGHKAPCPHAKHKFIEADSAKVSGKKITVKGHPATFHCGGDDDGHYTSAKTTETLTISPSAVIKVFKKPENPSKTVFIKATALPHWVKVNRSEPIYQVGGSSADVTKLTEQFHP